MNEEKVKIKKTKPTKTVAGKNTYTFNNCTVTINEEGKAIDVLAKKEATSGMLTELGMKLVSGAVEVFTKRNETKTQPSPTTDAPKAPEVKSVTKKVPVTKKLKAKKKVSKLKPKRKPALPLRALLNKRKKS